MTDRDETASERLTLLGLIRKRLRSEAEVFPTSDVPTLRRRGGDFQVPPDSGLRVTWLGHATTLVEIDGQRLLIDPVWSMRASPVRWIGPRRFFAPPLPLDELPEIDAVLISHDHYDHLDRRTVTRLAKRGLRFIVPAGVGAHLTRWGVDGGQLTELTWWQSARVGDVEVTATPSRHFSGRSAFGRDRNRALWAGFAMVGLEHRVYYAGDGGFFDGFEDIGSALGPFDLSLIEIGAYNRMWADVHLGPEQAIRAHRAVRGGLLLPIHWGTFKLAFHSWTEPVERLLVEAQRTGTPIVIPRPGESIEPARAPDAQRWWPDIAWETAEEHPVVASSTRVRGPAGSTPRDMAPVTA